MAYASRSKDQTPAPTSVPAQGGSGTAQPQTPTPNPAQTPTPGSDQSVPANYTNTPTGTGIIPPIYQKAATQLGIDPLTIYDISISADNTQLLVRVKDGRTLTTTNPEYVPKISGTKATYIIKYDNSEAFSKNGMWNQNPGINDTNGFNNIGVGSPEFDKIYGVYPIKRADGTPVTSFLDWTKQKWGNSTDILGLQGYAAYCQSLGDPLPFIVTYKGEKPITTPSAPTAAPTLTDWQTYYSKMTLSTLQSAQTKLKGGKTALPATYINVAVSDQLSYVNNLVSKMTQTTTTKQIYNGGTAINTPAPAVICEKGTDGNMYCHPK